MSGTGRDKTGHCPEVYRDRTGHPLIRVSRCPAPPGIQRRRQQRLENRAPLRVHKKEEPPIGGPARCWCGPASPRISVDYQLVQDRTKYPILCEQAETPLDIDGIAPGAIGPCGSNVAQGVHPPDPHPLPRRLSLDRNGDETEGCTYAEGGGVGILILFYCR